MTDEQIWQDGCRDSNQKREVLPCRISLKILWNFQLFEEYLVFFVNASFCSRFFLVPLRHNQVFF